MDLRQRDHIDRWRRETGGHPAGVRALEAPDVSIRRPIAAGGLVLATGCLAAWLTLLAWSGSAAPDPSRGVCLASGASSKACPITLPAIGAQS
jgi:hypothetical protein